MKAIPVAIRERILKLYDQGKGTTEIAAAFGYCVAATEQFEQKYGCDDARIFKYENTCYAFYTGNDGGKIALCEALSTNCTEWTKLGVI